MVRKLLVGLLAVIVIAIGGAAIYLVVAPPELLRVADGYAAKIVCSNVFLAGRDPQEVLSADVQAPGNPVLKFIRLDVDKPGGTVTARMLGLFATGEAVYRPGLGCSAVPDGNVAAARKVALPAKPEIAAAGEAEWPEGDSVGAPFDAIAKVLSDPALTGPGMRAAVVVENGKIVGEAYGAGFDAATPLLGWSMTKSVNALLLGRVMADGKIGLDDAALFPDWTDGRKDIRVRDLTSMTSGLAFNEDYGDVTDITRMLYLEPDMAKFAAEQPAVAKTGETFAYSSGTAVMLARLWMSRLPDAETALAYPRTALFAPLGMISAVMEADEAGTLVGGSYIYATGRDWARIGQFLLQDGVWDGQRLEPEGFVQMMATTNGKDGGYSQMQTWLEPDAGLPAGSFWLEGHDGQSVTVIPSAGLVVVRLGLTPSDLGYSPTPLVKAVLAAGG